MPSRKTVLMTLCLALGILGMAACAPSGEKHQGKGATLAGRVVLPADTFVPDTPGVGRELDPVINGRELPFGPRRPDHPHHRPPLPPLWLHSL